MLAAAPSGAASRPGRCGCNRRRVGELGQAADTRSWEASWRHSRSAGPHDAALLLCGPGSMQVLPPAAAARHAAGTPGLGAALQPAPSLGPQQTALTVDGLLLGGAAQEAAQRPGRQQQVVVDDSLIEAVLGPRRYESLNNAGVRLQPLLCQPGRLCEVASMHAFPACTLSPAGVRP